MDWLRHRGDVRRPGHVGQQRVSGSSGRDVPARIRGHDPSARRGVRGVRPRAELLGRQHDRVHRAGAAGLRGTGFWRLRVDGAAQHLGACRAHWAGGLRGAAGAPEQLPEPERVPRPGPAGRPPRTGGRHGRRPVRGGRRRPAAEVHEDQLPPGGARHPVRALQAGAAAPPHFRRRRLGLRRLDPAAAVLELVLLELGPRVGHLHSRQGAGDLGPLRGGLHRLDLPPVAVRAVRAQRPIRPSRHDHGAGARAGRVVRRVRLLPRARGGRGLPGLRLRGLLLVLPIPACPPACHRHREGGLQRPGHPRHRREGAQPAPRGRAAPAAGPARAR
mmetsp:Transcript_42015/g.112793  ORF Transcript_42015/g.112793 Transcript_42015/m.112793 type:complete len:331 (+) Transcript_42015:1496-2488(+)